MTFWVARQHGRTWTLQIVSKLDCHNTAAMLMCIFKSLDHV